VESVLKRKVACYAQRKPNGYMTDWHNHYTMNVFDVKKNTAVISVKTVDLNKRRCESPKHQPKTAP